MSAHQCPRCTLMFSFRTEVEYHLATDHRLSTSRRQSKTDNDAADSEAPSGQLVAPKERVDA